jgi:hypothetical protein
MCLTDGGLCRGTAIPHDAKHVTPNVIHCKKPIHMQ